MEGMSFDTPKGKMTFRKEDHQAMQSMYHFKIKADPAFAWGVPELVREIKPARWTFRSATSADVRRLRSGHASLRSAREPHVLAYVPVSAHRPAVRPGPDPCALRRSRSYFLEPANRTMLQTKDLTIRFGGHVAVNAVSAASSRAR
jgi:hypothetical protein